MPAVFVHGNPETSAIWSRLFDALDRDDLVALSPPGFGAPVPEGFGAAAVDYMQWLAGELEHFDEPVDLVGHDWGGGHTLGLLLAHPGRVRSWCCDVIGILHSDYEWHDAGKVWQTPGAGEQNVEEMLAISAADRAAMYEAVGMSPEAAVSCAEAMNEDMGRCILSLYRSAAQPAMAQLGELVGQMTATPGLVINAELDTFVGTDEMIVEMAGRAGAEVAPITGAGHWWMCEAPDVAAVVLQKFWASIEAV